MRKPMTVKRMIPHDDPVIVEHYADLLKTQPADVAIIETDDGVYRFQEDKLIRWTCDHGVSLNDMCVAFQRGHFSLEEYMRYYRGLGYSLSGFAEVFGDHLWP